MESNTLYTVPIKASVCTFLSIASLFTRLVDVYVSEASTSPAMPVRGPEGLVTSVSGVNADASSGVSSLSRTAWEARAAREMLWPKYAEESEGPWTRGECDWRMEIRLLHACARNVTWWRRW
jgi:hypothetical protein